MSRCQLASISVGTLCLVATVAWAGDGSLGFVDLMQFRQIEDVVISHDGSWVAYALAPDRGDGEVVVRSTAGEVEHRIERGAAPEISADGRWVVAEVIPTLEEREKNEDDDDPPRPGLAILDLVSGQEERLDAVESFALSADGRWLAYHRFENDEESGEENDCGETAPTQEQREDEENEREIGSDLVLRDLGGGSELTMAHVVDFVFAESAPLLAVTISAPEGEGNGVQVHDLRDEEPVLVTLHTDTGEHATHPTWADEAEHVAFVVAGDDEGEPAADAEVWTWTGSGAARRVASKADAPEGFTVPSVNELQWSRDGARLFFGFKPAAETDTAVATATATATGKETATATATEDPFDPYDPDAILADREVDVWHWKDPRIIPNQKERWSEHDKDRVYRAVVHLDDGKVVPLADLDLPEVEPTDNPRFALGRSDLPYLRELTWDGRFADLFAVDLQTGERSLFAARIAGGWRSPSASLSPDGKHALYYHDGDWRLYSTIEGTTRNLTADLPVSFADEDWDYPADPPGYGSSEWADHSQWVVIYDKYDMWLVDVLDGELQNLTRGVGRDEEIVFRVVDLDSESELIDPTRPFFVEGYHDRLKHDAFYAHTGRDGAVKLFGDGNHRLEFVGKAEDNETIVFTRERYSEFPDLWVSNLDLEDPARLTDVNPQIGDYAWGSAELVEWATDDGTELQGVLITPDGRKPGERVPVLVYYYRFFSHRLHLFNEPVVNHRPSFPVYASHGYAVFLPDIRFQVGRPGPSAVQCLTSGIEHLVAIGVADPEAVGLHGHSWSGYQTAYVVTQTDVFAAAVAGAPVSNMTSAYSGIRLGTGLARQFQYEKSQSRIGGSLWEVPELYIENSPVFFADEIDTPLLIQFGDEDEAVPWQQGIELYLACRRLDKDCIMLQYRGEPHHLKKTANKLDYSIKMKQFFDHHLKGEPAPGWMTDGVPYRGE
ncbi:MAG: prolyl oligopeptidase family serine peptidase [Thermoanaerobaculales bacterium]|nr:prolyl oligopeptidase family serine peptidase [Thermoanaerobaculales bacterium]